MHPSLVWAPLPPVSFFLFNIIRNSILWNMTLTVNIKDIYKEMSKMWSIKIKRYWCGSMCRLDIGTAIYSNSIYIFQLYSHLPACDACTYRSSSYCYPCIRRLMFVPCTYTSFYSIHPTHAVPRILLVKWSQLDLPQALLIIQLKTVRT